MGYRGSPTALDGWHGGTGHRQLRHLSTAIVVRTCRGRALLHCLPRLVRYLYCTVDVPCWIAVRVLFSSVWGRPVVQSRQARSAKAEYSNAMLMFTSPRLEGSNHANQSIRPQHTRTCVTGYDIRHIHYRSITTKKKPREKKMKNGM